MDAEVMCPPFIIGELAGGNLKNRNDIIALLQSLPMASAIEFNEILFLHEPDIQCLRYCTIWHPFIKALEKLGFGVIRRKASSFRESAIAFFEDIDSCADLIHDLGIDDIC